MSKAAGRPHAPFMHIKAKNKGSLVDSITKAYEPDAEFAPRMTEALVPAFLKKIITAAGKDKKLPDLIESARIIEVNRFGAFRLHVCKSSEEFRARLAEADRCKSILEKIIEAGITFREVSTFTPEQIAECKKISEGAKFREDFAVSSNTNNPATDPFAEFIPLMGGPFNKQLYLHDFLDMLAKSFEAWNHNPMAHQIVKITTHFVLGRGITFKARNEFVQKRFQNWWDEMDMNSRIEFWSDMVSRDGELMIRKFVNPMTKNFFLRWVDPSTVWEIVTDIEDIERVFYYHQQYPCAYQVLYGAPRGAKYNPSDFESSKYVINQIPAEEMYHVKINCSPNEKRGRSDLFPVLGWLKRYKDFHTGVVLRAIIQSVFAWKNKLTGTDTDVQAFVSAFGTDQPEFGSVWVENEASNLEPMTADLKGGSTALADCPGVVNAISVGSGIPKEYLGISDHGTRATAVVSSEPGVKKFQSRQLLMGRLLKDIAQDWFKNELAMGTIPKLSPVDDDANSVLRWLKTNNAPIIAMAVKAIMNFIGSLRMEPTDGSIEFQFPEIAVEDRSAKLKDIELTQQAGYISKRRAGAMSAKELGVEDYNYDDEMDEISDEQNKDISALYKNTAVPPGAAPKPPVPGAIPPTPAPAAKPEPTEPQPAPSGSLSSNERRDIKRNDRR